jgi:hypothetical protein
VNRPQSVGSSGAIRGGTQRWIFAAARSSPDWALGIGVTLVGDAVTPAPGQPVLEGSPRRADLQRGAASGCPTRASRRRYKSISAT